MKDEAVPVGGIYSDATFNGTGQSRWCRCRFIAMRLLTSPVGLRCGWTRAAVGRFNMSLILILGRILIPTRIPTPTGSLLESSASLSESRAVEATSSRLRVLAWLGGFSTSVAAWPRPVAFQMA